MPGKVFISCGQATDEEVEVASQVQEWFRGQGFDPYVALESQTIRDVNLGIIGELRQSDYYVFVDFPREQLRSDQGEESRGSLFTNQELAIAYLLGFEEAIFLQHGSIRREGLLKYMASNAARFKDPIEVQELVSSLVARRGWDPDYSRHLLPKNLRWNNGLIQYGHLVGKFLYIDIENRRRDQGALNAVARLAYITNSAGDRIVSPDPSPLKASARRSFVQVIWPESYGTWDLLNVSSTDEGRVYLNSELDISPKGPIISEYGSYLLDYEVFAEGFSPLRFSVEITVTGDHTTTEATLILK